MHFLFLGISSVFSEGHSRLEAGGAHPTHRSLGLVKLINFPFFFLRTTCVGEFATKAFMLKK